MNCEINALTLPARIRRFTFALTILGVIVVMCPAVADASGLRIPYRWTIRSDAQSGAVVRDSVPGSNSIVDLRAVDDDVWAATEGGVSHYIALDDEWENATTADGLGSNQIPAFLYVDGSHIWSATSHTDVVEGTSAQFGDGIFLSMDGGEQWLDASPNNGQASGPFSLCFDLASFRGNIVAACFAGGLVITGDQGNFWENIFYTSADSADYVNRDFTELSNRYFSAVADTTLEDSLVLYTGSADGIIKYVYLDSALIVQGGTFYDIATDGRDVYVATDRGLSYTRTSGTNWTTWYTDAGFPTNRIGKVYVSGDTVIAGITDGADDVGAGIAISIDGGDTWSIHEPPQAVGKYKQVKDIITTAGAIWVACYRGGLIRSEDLGQTWTNVFPDSTLAEDYRDTLPPNVLPDLHQNYVNTLASQVHNDTTYLFAGTEEDLITYEIPGNTLPTRAGIGTVGEATGLGHRILGLGVQNGTVDGDLLWAWTDTVPGVAGYPGYALSSNLGVSWRVANANLLVRGLAFDGNVFWMATDATVYASEYPTIDADSLTVQSGYLSMLTAGRIKAPAHDIGIEFSSSEDDADPLRIWVATDSGLAFFTPATLEWSAYNVNRDPLQPNIRSRFYYTGTDTIDTDKFLTLSGNFVTALAIQRQGNTRTLWAGTQTTGTGQKNGISRSTNGGVSWVVPITGHRVWNFAFDGANVWAASTEGLLHSPDNGATWDTLSQFVDPESGASIDSLTEIFAVAVVGNEIWVGSDNGIAFLDRGDPTRTLRVRRTFQPVTADHGSGEGGTYATPVPFSPNFHPNGVRIHYTPPVDGPVTITIYDFGNREVRILTDGEQRSADVTYHESDIWDGRNGKGDLVAVGTYFYVIEYSNGDVHWGKMAVIP